MGDGVLYVVAGDDSFAELAAQSIRSLRAYGKYRGPVVVVADRMPDPLVRNASDLNVTFHIHNPYSGESGRYISRHLKTQLYQFSPFKRAIYLDCDTLVTSPITSLFDFATKRLLSLAIDLMPTVGHLHEWSWEYRNVVVRAEEEETTRMFPADHPYYNGGVLVWRKDAQVKNFFKLWHSEWKRYADIDQMALLRAIGKSGIKVNVLPQKYNMPVEIKYTNPDEAKNLVVVHGNGWRDAKARLSMLACRFQSAFPIK